MIIDGLPSGEIVFVPLQCEFDAEGKLEDLTRTGAGNAGQQPRLWADAMKD